MAPRVLSVLRAVPRPRAVSLKALSVLPQARTDE
jgi:hypothetical protein